MKDIDLYEKSPKLQEAHIKLHLANGEKMAASGEFFGEINLSGLAVEGPLVVAPIGTLDGVIGLDLLEKLDVVIKLSLGELIIGQHTIAMFKKTAPSCCRIAVQHTVTIPPNSELYVSGKVVHKAKTSSQVQIPYIGVVESLKSVPKQYGVLMARSVVQPKDGEVPLKFMNLNDESVTIDKGCTVALLVPAAGVIDVGIDEVINSSEGSEERLAEHIQPLLDECKEEIGPLASLKLCSFLKNYTDVFSSPKGKLGVTHKAEHTIDTGDTIPIKQRAWRLPFARREVAEKEVERMLEQGVIEPSTSPWASPIVLVTKKDGSVRFCVDYRKINSCTRKDAYPLPRVSECLDTLAGAKWFSTLDLTSGYWQVPMAEQDKHKTAFTVGGGLYQFKVLPFGLCNAPATFERLMEMVLNGLQWKQCLVYLDDFIVFGSFFDTALENLSIVFDCLRTAGLTLKPKKCFLF